MPDIEMTIEEYQTLCLNLPHVVKVCPSSDKRAAKLQQELLDLRRSRVQLGDRIRIPLVETSTYTSTRMVVTEIRENTFTGYLLDAAGQLCLENGSKVYAGRLKFHCTPIVRLGKPTPAWRITQQFIDDPEALQERSIHYRPELEYRMTERWRCLDGDGGLYYEGIATPETDFEPLYDYCQPNAGCTEIQYLHNGEWKTL